MKTPVYFNLLTSPDKLNALDGMAWIRPVVCVLFIALIALFFTAPVADTKPRTSYKAPPAPAKLALEQRAAPSKPH